MDLWLASLNLPNDNPDTDPYAGVATFPGCAWDLWAADASTRLISLSRGLIPQENWCDLSLTANYPISCGLRRNSTTGVKAYYCAAKEELCPLDVELPVVQIPEDQAPPILGPVDPADSATDPSCGPNVPLSSYYQIDKYGGLQTELNMHQNILQLEDLYVQVEVTSLQSWSPPGWWNGGKAPAKYIFETNTTSTVAGQVKVTCSACTPVMHVFIHPIAPTTYAFPATRIHKVVDLTAGVLTDYAVGFTPNETFAGQTEVGGLQFPETVFRGVGYRIYGLAEGDSFQLYNPVITNAESQARCENRTRLSYQEPLGRAKSTVSVNKCVISEEDQDEFDNQEVGTCACDLAYGGPACDCPALADSKYGKRVCGGVGDEGKAVLPPDQGAQQVTGFGEEAGCYVYGTGAERRPQCKCIDIGTAIYTLQDLSANMLWDWPRVFVEAPPSRGARLFVLAVSGGEWVPKAEVDTQCTLQSAGTLPYALGSGEFTAMAEAF